MTVFQIDPAGFGSNCFLVTKDGKNAVAIDPAQDRILQEAEKRGLTVKAVLLTHGHFDHIGGCAILQRAGAKIYCLDKEKSLVEGRDNLAQLFGEELDSFRVDETFRDGETLSFCGVEFTVMATPGHTAGSVCFLLDDILFSGDTLFQGSVGRVDFPTGNGAQLDASLKKLTSLSGVRIVYCGHGDPTTLEYERENNPYIS